MAYDPDNHVVDPVTGMLRHKDTGHLIGIEQVPARQSDVTDWPKWVEPHASHRLLQGDDHVVVHGFDDYHVARDGRVTVLCRDEDDERRAVAELVKDEPHPAEVEASEVE